MPFLRIDTVCVKVNTLMSQLDSSTGHTVAAVPRPDPLLCGCDHPQAEQQRWRPMVGNHTPRSSPATAWANTQHGEKQPGNQSVISGKTVLSIILSDTYVYW